MSASSKPNNFGGKSDCDLPKSLRPVKNMTDAAKRARMEPWARSFINAVQCRRKALLEPFPLVKPLPDRCNNCDLCMATNGEQHFINFIMGKPDITPKTNSTGLHTPKALKPALFDLLDEECERIFRDNLFKPNSLVMPSLIFTKARMKAVSDGWRHVNSLTDLNNILGWKSYWSDKYGSELYAKAKSLADRMIVEWKTATALKSADTRKRKVEEAVKGANPLPLSERSPNIPYMCSILPPAKCWKGDYPTPAY